MASEKDLLEEIAALNVRIDALRKENGRQRRMIDELTEENKEVRQIKSIYERMLGDKPIKTGTLKESVKLLAKQIQQLEHDLRMERMTKQYAAPEPHRQYTPQELEPAKRGRPRKISEETRAEIHRLHDEGVSVRKIAQLTQTATGTVYSIIRSK